MIAEVKVLRDSTFRETAKALRAVADQIEAGDFGDDVSAHTVVVDKDNRANVFGAGFKSSPAETCFAFQRGIEFLCKWTTDRG